jgi:hypothetical protein
MKAPLFPRDTTHWPTVQLPAWRAVTLSTVETAAITGVVARAFRALMLTRGAHVAAESGWMYLAATIGLVAFVMCAMLTLHLSNFPVRRWPWRVLLFALVEAGAEMIVSAILIAAGREPLGTSGRAHWHDFASLAGITLLVRVVALGVFAAVLALVVQLVRVVLGRRGPHHLHHHPTAPHEP